MFLFLCSYNQYPIFKLKLPGRSVIGIEKDYDFPIYFLHFLLFASIIFAQELRLILLLWKIIKNPSNMWVDLVTKKYLKNSCLLDYIPSVNCSWQWKKLMSTREIFIRGLRWIVNSGDFINFWDGNWVFSYLPRLFAPRLWVWVILRLVGLYV